MIEDQVRGKSVPLSETIQLFLCCRLTLDILLF